MSVAGSTPLLARLKTADRLPSPPGTALRALELCRRDDTDIHQIADVIMSDPALSGRLLRYANSRVVRVGRKVTSVRDAVLLLGLRTVKMTALGFSVASPDFQPGCPGFQLSRFWAESYAAATVARRIASGLSGVGTDREEAFTAALLAGIGRLVFAQTLPEDYAEVLSAAAKGSPLIEVERAVLGIDHHQFGAQLLAEWGLPDVLVEAVRHQAAPPSSQQPPSQAQILARTVRAATQLAPLFTAAAEELSPKLRDRARHIVEHELNLNQQDWQSVVEQISEDYRQMAGLFNVELEGPVSVFDLYAEAQEEATRVGMVAQLERTRALEENKALLHRATTDPLTGIANRAKFDDRIEREIAGLRREHGHFALLLFDIDEFKRINDTYGHPVGDLVLKQIACVIRNALREVDLLARYGGDEFAILAPHVDQRGGCTIAARVRKCVQELRVETDGRSLQVTTSIGLAFSSDYKQAPTPETILADADKQLYLSKRAGRNTWSYRGLTASAFAKPRPATMTRALAGQG
jgi:diguanylate cyclase (GGDEF)-like protein